MATTTKVDVIIDGLRSRIQAGEFGSDGRLPSFRKLVAEYETSQETMNKAMQALQAEGVLLSYGAKGVFVNTPHIRLLGIAENFYHYLQEQVPDPIAEYIDKPTILKASTEIAQIMNVPEETLVLRRFMKQGTRQTTFRLEESYYPKKYLTTAMIDEIKKDASYAALPLMKEKFGATITDVSEEVMCRLPSDYEQDLLKIVRNNPVIDIRRKHYSKDKKTVIFYTHMILNANHFLLSYNYEVNFWK